LKLWAPVCVSAVAVLLKLRRDVGLRFCDWVCNMISTMSSQVSIPMQLVLPHLAVGNICTTMRGHATRQVSSASQQRGASPPKQRAPIPVAWSCPSVKHDRLDDHTGRCQHCRPRSSSPISMLPAVVADRQEDATRQATQLRSARAFDYSSSLHQSICQAHRKRIKSTEVWCSGATRSSGW
jgi:hypothetical protein